jgi:hypothetical protein
MTRLMNNCVVLYSSRQFYQPRMDTPIELQETLATPYQNGWKITSANTNATNGNAATSTSP